MGKASREDTFNAPIEAVFKVITDFEKYPQIMDGVTSIDIISQSDQEYHVRFYLNLIKEFTYELKLKASSPTKLSWEFVSGDFFKKNSGSWTLTSLDNGKTKVAYEVDIDFKLLVPSMITKKLVANNLPSMMKSVEAAAQKIK